MSSAPAPMKIKTKKIKTKTAESEAPIQVVEDAGVRIEAPVEAPATPVEVVETPVEATPVEAPATPASEEAEYSLHGLLESIQAELYATRAAQAKLSKLMKMLPAVIRKETKKSRRKAEKSSIKREQKKRAIVDGLAVLMGLDQGTELTRGEVQSFICKYVKEHNLQCEDDKKCFITDDALEGVLGAPEYPAHKNNTELRHSYNNLMKVLAKLFV